VATTKGLVTPVVWNAEFMGLVDVESEIDALGKKARDGKLSLEDMAGSGSGTQNRVCDEQECGTRLRLISLYNFLK